MPENPAIRTDIQGLRAMAVLVVVLFHAKAPGFSGGFVGVDIFFVISGYVIGLSMMREIDRTGALSLRNFYSRRARRILPAFVAMATVVMVAGIFLMRLGRVQAASSRTAIAAAFSLANMQLNSSGGGYFDLDEELNSFLHTWSLGVEEQFYVAVPILMVVLNKMSTRSRVKHDRLVYGGPMGVLVASSLLLSAAYLADDRIRAAFYSPLARFWEIGAGLLLAITGLQIRPRAARLLFAAGLGVLVGGVILFDNQTRFPGFAALVPVLSTAALVVSAQQTRLAAPLRTSVAL